MLKKLTTYKGRKILLIVLGVVGFILIGLHLLITFQSKQIANAIIAQYGEGRYEVKFEKVRFNYFNLSISIIGISIKPVDTLKSSKGYYLECDTVRLKLHNILPLLLRRQINIEEFDIVNSNFKIRQRIAQADHQKLLGDSTFLFSKQIIELSKNMLGFMNALEIRSCKIENADFSFYPDPNSNLHYNLENIYLNVRDLGFEEGNENYLGGIKFKAKIQLKIIQPNLQYPDSNLSIFLDKLEWDNSARVVQMDNLSFIQKKPGRPNDSTIIQLS